VDEIGISAPSVGVPRIFEKNKNKKRYLHLKNKYSKKIKTKKGTFI
jgi:hypothetical protein